MLGSSVGVGAAGGGARKVYLAYKAETAAASHIPAIVESRQMKSLFAASWLAACVQ